MTYPIGGIRIIETTQDRSLTRRSAVTHSRILIAHAAEVDALRIRQMDLSASRLALRQTEIVRSRITPLTNPGPQAFIDHGTEISLAENGG